MRKLKFVAGSCEHLTNELIRDLERIDNAQLTVIPYKAKPCRSPDMMPVRCPRLFVNDELVGVGFTEIDGWLKADHIKRVSEKRSRLFRDTGQPAAAF